MTGPSAGVRAADVRRMTFDDNALVAVLYGNHDRHLVRLEQLANVQLSARGNQLAIAGTPDDATIAHKALAGVPLLGNLLHPDRWLLWLGVAFILCVYFFPTGIVGRLRALALARAESVKGAR